MFIGNYSVMSSWDCLTPATSFMEAQKHQSWWNPPDAHTPQHSIFTCCFTFPQTITFPGSRGFGGESWLPSPVKTESLLGSGSHSPQAWPASCTSPSTPLLSIDGSPNSTSVSISRIKTLHKRDLGLEQSFYHCLLIDLYRKQTPSHQDYPRYKDGTGVWVSDVAICKGPWSSWRNHVLDDIKKASA